ncbi:Exosome complex exonuclease RRP46 [Phytophthora cinnamomi]|uniref:Exosome complex exonuclease RRP46 n=1 Tax=Phytophthora cinnamomi TaxID=4785 RepID=UPI00355A852E|nr:Exosome complex exonuclease RRP46 [Phytophthora cinnamomi]
MEKDLRDAYAALKLLRADLVKTRRDKRALEASLTHLQAHGPLPSAAQARAGREAQQMQQEDFNSQLWRMAKKYEARLGEMERNFGRNNCQKKEESPKIEDNQTEEEEDDDEGVEKLALINKLHSLTTTMEQQTQTMLAQQAAFALQKAELETRLEDAQHALQTEKSKVVDAVLEQQAAKENYEFLETQVEILKEENTKFQEEKEKVESKLATHTQTSGILKQQLQEKEEERTRWENEVEGRELELRLEHAQKMDALVEEVSLRVRRENEQKEKELRDKFERQVAELQQKCELLERELSSGKKKSLQDLEEVQEQYSMTLQDLESKCADLQKKLEESEDERATEAENHEANLLTVQGEYSKALRNLKSILTEVQMQLTDAKAKQVAEAREHSLKFTEASDKMRDQEKAHEKLTSTVQDLERTLEDVRAQLAAAETKLSEHSKHHEKKFAEASHSLHVMQDANNQHVQKLHDLESKLAESESNRLEYEAKLAEASQLAVQHEKAARALTMEKKALQQEVREARQTSKLTTEEFLRCQSVMKQKTQEHLLYLNQVQGQCESLETQLLGAEDHELAPAAKPVDSSYTLKAFHGLSDKEIATLPPSKSWKLLRSGINEMDVFLPHLQTLLGAMSETLKLCERHADTLPTLSERLQGKVASEKGESSILSVAFSLLRFAVMLKARIKQEEASLDQKTVTALRRRVLTALAQWYESDAGDNENGSMPIPTFTISSRETALILHNWTHDRTRLLGVRRWLARMEAYPGVPPLKGASSNRVLELPPEGCTLELEDMTPEVKDAFRLLLIPILKQNRALHVRVFTRYTGDAKVKKQQQQRAINGNGDHNEDSADKVWAMRIHVQSAINTHRRSSGSARPTPLNLTPSPHGPPSPLAPTSPASSVSSSTSSTASSRLQIIQERLQYLHNNG